MPGKKWFKMAQAGEKVVENSLCPRKSGWKFPHANRGQFCRTLAPHHNHIPHLAPRNTRRRHKINDVSPKLAIANRSGPQIIPICTMRERNFVVPYARKVHCASRADVWQTGNMVVRRSVENRNILQRPPDKVDANWGSIPPAQVEQYEIPCIDASSPA